MMEITLNGQTFSCNEAADVAALIGMLDIDPRSIAIELNRQIVSKSLWQVTQLSEGDKVEIVQFVGGG